MSVKMKKSTHFWSEQWESSEVGTTLGLFSLVALGLAFVIQNSHMMKHYFMVDKPHPNKTLLTFDAFFPFYLTEHSDKTNRTLHFIGTSLIITGCLVFSPRTLASIFLSMPIATCAFYLNVHAAKGFAEFALLLLVVMVVNRLLTGGYRNALAVMVCGYGFAWFGHFVFEKNQPATFTYPTFSLMSDFYMWFQLITGQIGF